MSLQNAREAVLGFFDKHLGKQGEVIGISREQEGWTAEIEVVEESDYMRKHGRNDLMAIYEVEINENFEIMRFERKRIRERGKVDS